MADTSDPGLSAAVADVKDDNTETNWCLFKYEGKAHIVVDGVGSGGHPELLSRLRPDQAQYALLRLVDGDQESRRIKFVFITWVGPGVNGMIRGRVTIHKNAVATVVGQFHVEVRAEDVAELALDGIMRKLKAAGGADYDTGSNKSGYASKGGSIKAAALASYTTKEKETTIGPVVYETKALAQSTPVDLGGRAMVAPSSEARKNVKDTILDTTKFKGKVSTLEEAAAAAAAAGPAPAPAATARPTSSHETLPPAAAAEPDDPPPVGGAAVEAAAEESAPADHSAAAAEAAAPDAAAEFRRACEARAASDAQMYAMHNLAVKQAQEQAQKEAAEPHAEPAPEPEPSAEAPAEDEA